MRLRIRRLILLVLLAGPIGGAVPVYGQASAKEADAITRLERVIPRLMTDGDVPGLAIALVQDGRIVWHRGFGVKNVSTGEPVQDDTVFEAASLGKPVFAYAVMKLVDSGKFDLDKPLSHYLPGNYGLEGDPRLNQITARRVLSHTTGLPNWRTGALKIYFAPGERFSYSGEGFVYLSKVIEQVTGEKTNDFVNRTVFEPLGMASSSYVWRGSYSESKTAYHNTRGEPARRNNPSQEANVASSLHTTAHDYARFVVAMLAGTGLTPETRRVMLTAQAQVLEGGATSIERPEAKPFPGVSWGLGWGLQTTAAGLSMWHWGNNGDAKAYVVALEKQKSGVVIFANSVNGLSIVPEIVAEAVGGAQPALAWLRVESDRSPARLLFKSFVARGAEVSLVEYLEWRKGRPQSEVVNEDQMNRFGLDLLRMGRIKDAIDVLKQNVADYPASFNVYDSLAEAYAANGERELAIKNYNRSIELNPNNKGGIEALGKLQSPP